MKTIKDLKLTRIDNVFDCNKFDENEMDILIGCEYNFSENDFDECEDYLSDGLPFISAFVNIKENTCLIQLCDCYSDMKYNFSDSELTKIRNIVNEFLKTI